MGAETTGMIAATLSEQWKKEGKWHPTELRRELFGIINFDDEPALHGLSRRQKKRVFTKALDQANRTLVLQLNRDLTMQEILGQSVKDAKEVREKGMRAWSFNVYQLDGGVAAYLRTRR